MTARLRVLLAVGVLGAGVPRAAPAQSTPDWLARAVRAYRDLEFSSAASLLRRGLAAPDWSPADSADRGTALSYLAASDLYRGRRDSAAAVFRRLVIDYPRYQPDSIVFPPEVVRAFKAVQQATKVVTVAVAADTTIRVGEERYVARLYASSAHDVLVAVRYEDGQTLRTLYAGPIADSLVVGWDGSDTLALLGAGGRLLLTVTSLPAVGMPSSRAVQLALQVSVVRRDTLPLPLLSPSQSRDAQLLPERAGSGPALKSLTGGVLVAAAVMALPAIVADGARPSGGGARVAVAGTIGIAGLIGFVAHRPGRPLQANIATNRARQAARLADWQRRVEQVRSENDVRRRDVRLRIVAGAPVVTARGAQ